ncbi:unnamed protein product [Brassica oleracea var. botrytis]
MKACVILMLVICAAVIVEQSEAGRDPPAWIDPVNRCFNNNPKNLLDCVLHNGPPRPANEYRRGCSEKHHCRGGTAQMSNQLTMIPVE